MKLLPTFGCVALGCAAVAFAGQTPADPPSPAAAQTPTSTAATDLVTMTGCVSRGATARDPFTLANAVIAEPNATAPTPGGTTPGGTAMAGGTTTPGPTPPAGTVGATAPTGSGTAGAVGTSGTTGATAGAGTSGTATGGGSAPGAGTAATSGTSGTGTAAASGSTPGQLSNGTSMPAAGGATGIASYRLSGASVSNFAGQRVEIVGRLASSTVASGSPSPRPEFRVVSVRRVQGTCP